MRCRNARILMTKQLREELAPEQLPALDRHLAGCPGCRAERVSLETLAGRLLEARSTDAGPAPAMPPPQRWRNARTASLGSRRPFLVPAVLASAPGGRAARWTALSAAGVAAAAVLASLVVPTPRPAPNAGGGEKGQPYRQSAAPTPHAGVGEHGLAAREPRVPAGERPRGRVPLAHSTVPSPSIGGEAGSEDVQRRPHPRPLSIKSGWRGEKTPPPGTIPRAEPRLAASIRVHPRPSAASPSAGDDLAYLNGAPGTAIHRWTQIPPDEIAALEARLRGSLRGGDDFVSVPLPRLAAAGPRGDRQAAEAVAAYQREAAVVDARLFRKGTLRFKAAALSDLCERLRADTGIQLEAGKSVADEKVTLFCKETPLRDVMRQLSRPFGYTWLRSGKEGEYKYELVQDLRSQLLEEELRNRDRNASLIALDREMEPYRKYLALSPEEARARARTAPPEEKRVLERLAGPGWGAAQLYFRLTPADLAALRSGQALTFSAPLEPQAAEGAAPPLQIGPGLRFSLAPERVEQPLPPGLARGVLQGFTEQRVLLRDGRLRMGTARDLPEGVPPATLPEARPMVNLRIDQTELGQMTLAGGAGYSIRTGQSRGQIMEDVALAMGESPSVRAPGNAVANAKLTREPALQSRVSLRPQPSCQAPPEERGQVERGQGIGDRGQGTEEREVRIGDPATAGQPRVNTADVLEALHNATGLPVVGDYYTRLYPISHVAVGQKPLFEALSHVADAMRLRWAKEGDWLQFRSASFFQDRLKEVPNRLLARWSAARRESGALSLDELIEIAQLADAQLDSEKMAEGARLCFGLVEWELGRHPQLRSHLRFLAGLSPAQRQQVRSGTGLGIGQMSLAQQQAFVALGLGPQADRLKSIEDLAGASLRVEYTVPGWFERVVREEPGGPPSPGAPFTPRPAPVVERTREAALQAARRIDPSVGPEQIAPTRLAVRIIHSLRDPNTDRPMEILRQATPGNFSTGIRMSRPQ